MKQIFIIIALVISMAACKKDCQLPETKKEIIRRPDPQDRPIVDTTVKRPIKFRSI